MTHKLHNTTTHKLHNTTTHKLHNTTTHKLHNITTHKLHNATTHKLHNTTTHKLRNSTTHKLHNTTTHKLHNTPPPSSYIHTIAHMLHNTPPPTSYTILHHPQVHPMTCTRDLPPPLPTHTASHMPLVLWYLSLLRATLFPRTLPCCDTLWRLGLTCRPIACAVLTP